MRHLAREIKENLKKEGFAYGADLDDYGLVIYSLESEYDDIPYGSIKGSFHDANGFVGRLSVNFGAEAWRDIKKIFEIVEYVTKKHNYQFEDK